MHTKYLFFALGALWMLAVGGCETIQAIGSGEISGKGDPSNYAVPNPGYRR